MKHKLQEYRERVIIMSRGMINTELLAWQSALPEFACKPIIIILGLQVTESFVFPNTNKRAEKLRFDKPSLPNIFNKYSQNEALRHRVSRLLLRGRGGCEQVS